MPVFFAASSKMNNCVSTAPARADRGSDLLHNLTKTQKKQPVNQHTYKPDFPPKSTSTYHPKIDENLTSLSLNRPSLHKPVYLKS